MQEKAGVGPTTIPNNTAGITLLCLCWLVRQLQYIPLLDQYHRETSKIY